MQALHFIDMIYNRARPWGHYTVAKPVYKAIRESCRGGPVDLVSLSAYLSSKKGSQSLKLDPYASIIPCSTVHPDSASRLAHQHTVCASHSIGTGRSIS
jgi:hypothetical protein